MSNGDGTHTRTCQREGCGATETVNCSGGTATCIKKAVCRDCGAEYGDIDSNNHTGGTATCTEKAICQRCGEEYGETDPNNHTGGTATCTAKAICQRCREEYGETDPYNHDYEVTVTKEPTCIEPGSANYVCKNCNDSGTETIPATGHGFDQLPRKEVSTAEGSGIEFECAVCHVKETRPLHIIEYKAGETYTYAGWDNDSILWLQDLVDRSDKYTLDYVSKYAVALKTSAGELLLTLTFAEDTKVWTVTVDKGVTGEDGDTVIVWSKGYEPEYGVKCRFIAKDYTITYDLDGGTAEGNPTGYNADTGTFTLKNPSRPGYTFTGWSGTGLTGENNLTVTIEKGSTSDRSYTAHWELNTYTITFDTAGGSEIAPITQDYGTPITATADPTREGYQFNGWDKTFPTTMPAENLTITALWRDIAVPTGEIKIAENGWKSFLNTITFGLFFKDTQTVTVTATDNSGETVTIEYLLSEKALAESELAGMTFTAYSAPFSINPDNEYVIYAKLTDTSGNVAYINTNGIVLDATSPVITGIENGKTYCEAQTLTVDEKYVDTVTVNGTEVTLDKNGSFVLSSADGEQRIIVTDKAGNTAEMTVTVNDGHTFGEWTSNGDGTHTRKCTVDGCTGSETKDCSGGTATCKDKAKCAVCGRPTASLMRRTTPTSSISKAATKTSEGNIEYWYCSGCKKYYKDAAATQKIKQADTVTAKLPGGTVKPGADKSPQTGDNSNLLLWIALLFVSGGAVTVTTVYGRKKKRLTK